MKISQVTTEYIAFKQSMGMRFKTESVILKAFCRAMGDIDITLISSSSVQAYLDGTGPVTTFWHRKFDALSGFYRFGLSRGHVSFSPLPTIKPKRPVPFQSYIYTHDQFRNLIEMTHILNNSKRCHVQSSTFRSLLLLLYATGLRIGEALSLTLADADLSASLLTIRNAKFYKTRLVPIGPQLTDVLLIYSKTRRLLPHPVKKDSVFFSTRRGRSIALSTIERLFRQLCECAGIRREEDSRYQPRLHDIRHTFALNRLISWYRQGEDVQRLLPFLSTYLGHVDISATQRYLAMTPELLHEASLCFQRYATQGGHYE